MIYEVAPMVQLARRRRRGEAAEANSVTKSGRDDDERTNSIGLYHCAVSYHEGARALAKVRTTATRPDSPIYHAIELFLKSYLRLRGVSVADLASRRFGHRADRLGRRAAELGLVLRDEDMEVLRMMAETDIVIRTRYIRTGYFSAPSLQAVDRTCQSLRVSVCEAIKETGTFVRPLKPPAPATSRWFRQAAPWGIPR